MRLLILILFCSFSLIAQELQKDTVISAIQLNDTTWKSYAVYLPDSYNESQTFPIVFVFDDEGKGAETVRQFSKGAALTQSIIVSPNYVFSDSLNVSVNESASLINTVLGRLSVRQDRIILAGKDKGALMASTNAHLSEDVYGVIAINDVFIDEKILYKNSKAGFVILNNDTGREYYKLRDINSRYSFREKLKGYYEFETEEDGWPIADYLSTALVDLLYEDDNEGNIKKYYETDLAFGERLHADQKNLEAYDFVSDLKKQYKKYSDLKNQKELLKKIRASTLYKLNKIQRNQARFEEQLLRQDVYFFLEDDASQAYFDNLGWWNYQMDEIDATIDSTSTNAQQKKSAKRLKGFMQSQVEEVYEHYNVATSSLEQLLFINILRTLVNPTNQEAIINVISLSAKEGDTNAALFYLEELLATGFTDYDSLYRIEGTTAMRISEEWNAIIKDYLGKSKYYNH